MGAGLAKSSLSEENRRTTVCSKLSPHPSKDMPTHPDYASAAKRFVIKGIETTIDDG
jgi:hypothetical protein